MSICTILLIAFMHLVLTAINIVEFFLLVRAVLLWKEVAWLRSFDTSGESLVSSFTTSVDRLSYRVSNRHLSTRGGVVIGLLALELIRMMIAGIYGIICK